MGIERLYKLPGQDQPNPARLMAMTVSILVAIVVLTLWCATQYAAHQLAYQPALGEPVIAIGSIRIYSPIDFFLWMVKFGHVEGTEKAFTAGQWMIGSMLFLVVPAAFLASHRAKKLKVKSDLHGSAHFASREELYQTGLLPRPGIAPKVQEGKKPSPIVYVGGWYDDEKKEFHMLRDGSSMHVSAIAPTRSGKGVGLVLPTLLAWSASTVVHDLKGEAWNLTSGYRRAIGQRVLKFEPTNPDGTSVRFNPLDEIRLRTVYEVGDVQRLVMMLIDEGKGKGLDHWGRTAFELGTAVVLHILYAGTNKTLNGVAAFLKDPSRELEQTMEDMLNCEHDPNFSQGWVSPNDGKPVSTHPVVAQGARSLLSKSDNERSGVVSTLLSFLSIYSDEIIAKNTSASEFKIDDLMNGDAPVSLYVVVEPKDQGVTRPLVRVLFDMIARKTTSNMGFKDGRSTANYKHRLLMLIDEFPAMGRMDSISAVLPYASGYGVKYYLIAQDYEQLIEVYGKSETITSNCHLRIFYAPNKIETGTLISKYLGTMTVQNDTHSYSGSRLNPFMKSVSTSTQQVARPLLTPDETMRIPGPIKSPDGEQILQPGDMIVMAAGFAPIYGRQILYFQDKVFDGRSKIPAPPESDRLYDAPAYKLRPAVTLSAVAATPVVASGGFRQTAPLVETDATEDAPDAVETETEIETDAEENQAIADLLHPADDAPPAMPEDAASDLPDSLFGDMK